MTNPWTHIFVDEAGVPTESWHLFTDDPKKRVPKRPPAEDALTRAAKAAKRADSVVVRMEAFPVADDDLGSDGWLVATELASGDVAVFAGGSSEEADVLWTLSRKRAADLAKFLERVAER